MSGQEPSKSTFKKAIGRVLQGRPSCISLAFPEAVSLRNGKAEPSSQTRALLQVGLAEQRSAMVSANLLGWTPAKPNDPNAIRGMVYELSGEGEKYKGTTTGRFGSAIPGLCYATPEVVEVLRYTEPVSSSFGRVTHVTYSYRLTKIAAWARDPSIVSAFFLQEELLSPNQIRESHMSLVLTSEGWRDKP